MEDFYSPYAKICFAGRSFFSPKPSGSLPATVKQRSLENRETNKPKQPTESKDRKAPFPNGSQLPYSLGPAEPSLMQPG
jgi:hypothetical protein